MNNTGYSSITIDGEVIDLFFGIKADEHWFKCVGEDDDNEIMKPNGDVTPYGIGVLIYGGYVNYEASERRKPKYTIGHFLRHIDECMVNEEAGTELLKIVNDWRNSKYSLRTAALIKDGEDDSQLKKKSKRSTPQSILKP